MSTKKIPAKMIVWCDRCRANMRPSDFMGIRVKGSRAWTVICDTQGGDFTLDLCETCAREFDRWLAELTDKADGLEADQGDDRDHGTRGP